MDWAGGLKEYKDKFEFLTLHKKVELRGETQGYDRKGTIAENPSRCEG